MARPEAEYVIIGPSPFTQSVLSHSTVLSGLKSVLLHMASFWQMQMDSRESVDLRSILGQCASHLVLLSIYTDRIGI